MKEYYTRVGNVHCVKNENGIFAEKTKFDKFFKNLVNWFKLETYVLQVIHDDEVKMSVYYDISGICKSYPAFIKEYD